eukprot:1440111-Pleurochrysis_carterae.AAC.1
MRPCLRVRLGALLLVNAVLLLEGRVLRPLRRLLSCARLWISVWPALLGCGAAAADPQPDRGLQGERWVRGERR